MYLYNVHYDYTNWIVQTSMLEKKNTAQSHVHVE